MEYILLIVGFFLLVKGADIFVDGSSNLAKFFKIPTLIIGLTIVAFGTSAPEAAVSISASLKGSNAIAVGNVVGSNICNLLLVLGFSSLFATLKGKRQIVLKDYIFYLLSTVVLILMLFDDFYMGKTKSTLSMSEGLILLCFLGVYIYSLILSVISEKRLKVEKHKFTPKDLFYIIIGLLGVLVGGNFVVDSSVQIAINFGVSESVIALTIVAIGTSLPELVTSVMAARKGEVDIAIGNVIGSNIFNIFFILGASSTLSPTTVGINDLYDILIMAASSVIVYLFLLKNKRIGRVKGVIMLLMYAAYITYILIR